MLEQERDGAVLTLVFADPQRRNALGYPEVRDLLEALIAARNDPMVRCVVLTGRGSAFSAGGDLRGFQEELKGSSHDFWDSGAMWAELFTLVPRLPYPVVAAVNGPALAGGCGIVALADLAIAAADATFGLTEIRIGLFPIIVLPALERAVGARVARELALTGKRIGAEEAARVGLVNRVVPPDDLREEAMTTARELAALPPVALGLGKRFLADLAGLGYEAAVTHARAMRGIFLHTPDLAEGVSAFLDKRPPRW